MRWGKEINKLCVIALIENGFHFQLHSIEIKNAVTVKPLFKDLTFYLSYFPVKSGWRFSKNAMTPSLKSLALPDSS
jgi:hypothetical protein